jgi:hypothetical protein
MDSVSMPTDDSISWPSIFDLLVESLAEFQFDVDQTGRSLKPALTQCSTLFEPALQFIDELMGVHRLLPDVAIMHNFVAIFKAMAGAIRTEEEALMEAESTESGPPVWHPSFDAVMATFTYAFIWAFGGGIDEAKHGKFNSWLQELRAKGCLALPPDVSDAFNLIFSKDRLVRLAGSLDFISCVIRTCFAVT